MSYVGCVTDGLVGDWRWDDPHATAESAHNTRTKHTTDFFRFASEGIKL